jgi:predicted lipoprotein with Yx(FWY)xxD motif
LSATIFSIGNGYLANEILYRKYLVSKKPQGGKAMRSKFVIAGGLMTAALSLAACDSATPYTAGTSPSPSGAPPASPVAGSPSPLPTSSGTSIKAANSRLGEILVDANGITVYLFLADSGTTSNCNSSGCVQNWPPVLTMGAPQAGSGVSASLLGTTKRKDGTTEVTYAGHPLYYFIADKQPGQVTGQGIDAFGAPWYVVSPSGKQIG